MMQFRKITIRLQAVCKLVVSTWLLSLNVAQAEQQEQGPYPLPKNPAAIQVVLQKPASESVERPNFSGTWLLDASASDNPEAVIKTAFDQRKKPSSSRGGMPGGGMPRGGMPGGGMPDRMNQDMGSVKPPVSGLVVDVLEIQHSEPELTLIADRLDKETFYTDERDSIISRLGGIEKVQVTTGWEGNVLVIETRPSKGTAIIQRLRLLESPHRLERITEIPPLDLRDDPIEIKQVFTPWNR